MEGLGEHRKLKRDWFESASAQKPRGFRRQCSQCDSSIPSEAQIAGASLPDRIVCVQGCAVESPTFALLNGEVAPAQGPSASEAWISI